MKDVIPAPQWLVDSNARLRQQPPSTSEQVEAQFRAVEAIRWNYDKYPTDLKIARENAAKCPNMAASDLDFEVVGNGPVIVPPNLPARMVRFSDGSCRVETWYVSAWIPGGTSVVAMGDLPTASAEELRALGVL